MSRVKVDAEGVIAAITLADPDTRNALSSDMMRELRDAFRAVGETESLVVVLAAEGRVFSAGHNLKEFIDIELDDAQEIFSLVAELMTTIQSIPQIVIAKVQGVAAAGGAQLAASCDLVVAAETATFSLPGVKVGIFCHTPNVAMTRNIGMKRAMELAMTGDAISAKKAEDWGLINYAVPAEDLDAKVAQLATAVATSGPAFARAVGKKIFYQQYDLTQAQAYELGARVLASVTVGRDAQEGVKSFAEKRAPNFVSTPLGYPKNPAA